MIIAPLPLAAIDLATIDLTTIARATAERIGYCLSEGMLVAAFAGFLLWLVPRRNAGTRFAVWFSALVAIATLPLVDLAGRPGVHSLSAGGMAHAAITLPGSWALYVFGVWAAVAVLALSRVIAGLWQLYALRTSCTKVDIANLDPLLREVLASGTRRIAVCVSRRVHAPVAVGFTNPMVVMPSDLMQELSTAELKQVLLHELAHLRRWDDWTNLFQKTVRALLFFHPAVWWIERRLSLEREMACDDAVLKETASPRAYAECLAHLAEKNLIRRSTALAQAAVSRLRHTSLRVARILDGNRSKATTQIWRPAVLLVAVFAMACVIFLLRAPKLIGFEDSAPKIVSSAASSVATGSLPIPRTPQRVDLNSQTPGVTQARTESRERATGSARMARTAARPNRAIVDDASLASFQDNLEQIATGLVPVQLKDTGATRFVSSETFLFFVQGSQDDSASPAIYQVSVWRVTVVRLTNDPSSKNIPREVT